MVPPPARLDIPLGGQQGISSFNGASGQPQFLGQRPRRGNAVTGLQHSIGDSVAKPIVNLPVERCGGGWIKRRDFFGLYGRHGLIRSVDEREPIMPYRLGSVSTSRGLDRSRVTRDKSWTIRKAHSWSLDAGCNCLSWNQSSGGMNWKADMKKIHVICSPRGQASESYRISQKIVGDSLGGEPTATVIVRPVSGIADIDDSYATALGAVGAIVRGNVCRGLHVAIRRTDPGIGERRLCCHRNSNA